VQDALAWHFDAACRLKLGTPIAVGESCQINGLATAHWQVDAELRRRDVSALPMAEQDVQ